MHKNFVRMPVYGLYVKHTLGICWSRYSDAGGTLFIGQLRRSYVRALCHAIYCLPWVDTLSGPRVFQPLLVDPTQVESKKSSQIQWPVPSINAEPVDIFLGEE